MRGLKIGKHKWVLYHERVERVHGINSTLKDGRHIIMVDIDRQSYDSIAAEMEDWMIVYNARRADLVSTGKPYGWHVYIWKAVDFKESLKCMLDFSRVDMQHVRWTIKRGHATLRTGPKRGRKVTKVLTLRQSGIGGPTHKDLKTWVEYETANVGD